MNRILWPEFANRWLWLCPALAIVVAAGILWAYGFAWWSALLAALLLVCPVLILWGVLQIALEERQAHRRLRH